VDSSKLLRAIETDSVRHERELAVVKEPQARSAARAQATKFASAGLTTIDQLSRNQCNDYARRFREWFGSNPDGEVPHPVAEHERTARLGRWGTKLLMGFEVVFAAWITATFNFAQHCSCNATYADHRGYELLGIVGEVWSSRIVTAVFGRPVS
jgi:hypothetical protein